MNLFPPPRPEGAFPVPAAAETERRPPPFPSSGLRKRRQWGLGLRLTRSEGHQRSCARPAWMRSGTTSTSAAKSSLSQVLLKGGGVLRRTRCCAVLVSMPAAPRLPPLVCVGETGAAQSTTLEVGLGRPGERGFGLPRGRRRSSNPSGRSRSSSSKSPGRPGGRAGNSGTSPRQARALLVRLPLVPGNE